MLVTSSPPPPPPLPFPKSVGRSVDGVCVSTDQNATNAPLNSRSTSKSLWWQNNFIGCSRGDVVPSRRVQLGNELHTGRKICILSSVSRLVFSIRYHAQMLGARRLLHEAGQNGQTNEGGSCCGTEVNAQGVKDIFPCSRWRVPEHATCVWGTQCGDRAMSDVPGRVDGRRVWRELRPEAEVTD